MCRSPAFSLFCTDNIESKNENWNLGSEVGDVMGVGTEESEQSSTNNTNMDEFEFFTEISKVTCPERCAPHYRLVKAWTFYVFSFVQSVCDAFFPILCGDK